MLLKEKATRVAISEKRNGKGHATFTISYDNLTIISYSLTKLNLRSHLLLKYKFSWAPLGPRKSTYLQKCITTKIGWKNFLVFFFRPLACWTKQKQQRNRQLCQRCSDWDNIDAERIPASGFRLFRFLFANCLRKCGNFQFQDFQYFQLFWIFSETKKPYIRLGPMWSFLCIVVMRTL